MPSAFFMSVFSTTVRISWPSHFTPSHFANSAVLCSLVLIYFRMSGSMTFRAREILSIGVDHCCKGSRMLSSLRLVVITRKDVSDIRKSFDSQANVSSISPDLSRASIRSLCHLH